MKGIMVDLEGVRPFFTYALYILLGALCLVTCVLWGLGSDSSFSLVLMTAICPFALMVIGAVSAVQTSKSRKVDMEGSEEIRVRIKRVPGTDSGAPSFFFEKTEE